MTAAHAVPTRRRLSRLVAPLTLAAIAAAPMTLAAQEPAPAPRPVAWELLLSSGALVPTGAQRDAIADAQLSTAQLSVVFASRLAVTTMFGWARSRDLATAGDPKLDVFTFDVGGELRGARREIGRGMSLMPFAGAGAGSRSYDYRKLEGDAAHNLAGYGAVGAELGVWRMRVRLEARDYVTGFRPLAGGGTSVTRNDAVVLVGLRFGRGS